LITFANYIFCTRCKWRRDKKNPHYVKEIARCRKKRNGSTLHAQVRNERRDEVVNKKWCSIDQKAAPLVEIQNQQREETKFVKMSRKECEVMSREQERKEIILEWGDKVMDYGKESEVITEGNCGTGEDCFEEHEETKKKIEWGVLGDECDLVDGVCVIASEEMEVNEAQELTKEDRKRMRKQRRKKNKKKGDGKMIDIGKIRMVFDQIGKDILRDQGEKRVDESKNIGVAEEIWEKLNGFKSELLLAQSEKKGKDVVRDIQLRLELFKAEVVDKDGNIRSKGVG